MRHRTPGNWRNVSFQSVNVTIWNVLRLTSFTRVFRCWTRKEAYVKARREGRRRQYIQSDVSVAPGESHALLATRPDPSEAGRWILRLTMNSGDAAALAVATDCRIKPWPPIIDIWV
jgi:4'-phosphopantetheinyl transferase